jgi:hypothetical protein
MVTKRRFFGNDLANSVVTAGNNQYCAQAYKSHKGCNHFTYVPDSTGETGQQAGFCWVKYTLGISPVTSLLHVGLMSGILY